MIWLNSAAWVGLLAVAAPVIVHLLAHRRAERLPFPSLRFVQPTRLAAIRRRALTDVWLLVVRGGIIAAAAAAMAGPLLVTPARRASWNARLVRAIVAPATNARPDAAANSPSTTDTFRTERFSAASTAEAIHRAVAWLDAAPPARRELVVTGALAIGSITANDLTGVPRDIGVRFERTEPLPPERRVVGPAVMTGSDVRQRRLTLARDGTGVDEVSTGSKSHAVIDIVAPAAARRGLDAALAAVLSEHVWAPVAEPRAQVVAIDAPAEPEATVERIHTAWIAEAAARIAHDGELRIQAGRLPSGIQTASRAPWLPLLRASNGAPIVSAAASSGPNPRLIVAVPPAVSGDLFAPLLLRAIANSASHPSDQTAEEVIPIPDTQLAAWTRPPADAPPPRADSVEHDDRSWLWAVVLGLLALETWMRAVRRRPGETEQVEEAARVA